MSTTTRPTEQHPASAPAQPPPATEAPFFPTPDIELIETDGEPLESEWHRIQINLLVELIHNHFAGRTDFYAGGNMFVYFSEEHARNRDFRGPDFFFVRGVSPTPARRYWAVWKEGGHYPDVIIELLSPTTAAIDRTTKKDLYQKVWRTSNYFCYDPDTKQLEGWNRQHAEYLPLTPDERGRLWSHQLGLWLGMWDGPYQGYDMTWLRFFTPEGVPVPTAAEAGREIAEVEHRRAEAEYQRAEAERQRAEAERQRAEAERQRANALEAELARLRAQLGSEKPEGE